MLSSQRRLETSPVGTAPRLRMQGYFSCQPRRWFTEGFDTRDLKEEWLEEAYVDRSYFLAWLRIHPVFDSLRPDPRFTALLKKVGFE
jgi:hypothetical protein